VATERTYDYEYLRKLLREHPEWPHRQVAAAITEHERTKRGDPKYPAISVHAIASAKYRYRDIWEELGERIEALPHDPTRRSQPFNNLPKEYCYSYEIQALRTLTKIARGEPVSEKRRREAENLTKKLRRWGSVIDLSYNGEPYIRQARPDEVDGEGNLIEYAARFPGLTDYQWKALRTPEARAAASARWRALVEPGWRSATFVESVPSPTGISGGGYFSPNMTSTIVWMRAALSGGTGTSPTCTAPTRDAP